MSRSHSLVLFGATGDLARKKLFSSLYRLAARGRLDPPVIGVALSDWDNQQFRAHAREAIAASVTKPDADVVDSLCDRLSLIGGDYADPTTFGQLHRELASHNAPHSRPSTSPSHRRCSPPSQWGSSARDCTPGPASSWRNPLAAISHRPSSSMRCCTSSLRSPTSTGSTTTSERKRSRTCSSSASLTPSLNRNYIASVQITMAESFGVDGRGRFYESVGALRDVVQNHLLQVLALLTMEPPVSPDADALRDEKVALVTHPWAPERA